MVQASKSHCTFARAALIVSCAVAGLVLLAQPLSSQTSSGGSSPKPGEAWKFSPFHGVPNAATGRNIPCSCRSQGRDFRLGERVCLRTHLGMVIAVCDLVLNNSSWILTDEPCEMS